MQRKRWRIWIYILLIISTFSAYKVYAAVTVTAWSGWGNISADKAANATSPARTTLGLIRINEWANADIPANVNSWTIILTAPTGRNFNTATWTISYTAGRDITAISLTMAATTLTITLKTDATANARDRIDLRSIQIRALSGENQNATGKIMRLGSNPWTTAVAGITNNSTSFWSVNQTTWSLKNLEIILSGQLWWWAWVWVTWTPKRVFPNIAFAISGIRAVDQFDNMVTTFAWTKTLSYSGPSTASGANTYTTSVSFTAWRSTTALNTTLRTPWTYQITVASGWVWAVTWTSSSFTIMRWTIHITAPSSISLPAIAASPNSATNTAVSTNFVVDDQKAFSSGYYTTLQCSNLTAWASVLANTNIQLSGSALTLTSWDANTSVITSLTGSLQTCWWAITFIRRNSGAAWWGIFSEYAANITVRTTIPARQDVWAYTGTITYTLIEN